MPNLYEEDTEKVYVHHDVAFSHMAKVTMKYAKELKKKLWITIIAKSHIPIKAPDTSPIHFFGFSYLKQRLFKRKATTMDGLWKVLKEE